MRIEGSEGIKEERSQLEQYEASATLIWNLNSGDYKVCMVSTLFLRGTRSNIERLEAPTFLSETEDFDDPNKILLKVCRKKKKVKIQNV